MNKLQHQVLALAANLQAGTLVHQLANKGQCNADEKNIMIDSLFKTDTTDTLQIYKEAKNLKTGILILKNLLSNQKNLVREPIKYGMQLNTLAKKIIKEPKFIKNISTEIDALNQQKFFANDHYSSINKLAELYKKTAGKLSPTILIHGEKDILENTNIANQIRVLLLSGVRASILWNSHGGRGWLLLLNKRKMLETIKQLCDNY
jgi:high frequency lysogenization protein